MSNENVDVRALLAKMQADEDAANEKADKIKEENDKKRQELLKQLRDTDLADVIAKCKLHGFSATDLRGALKVKGAGRKPVARKSTARKTTTRGRKAKSA
jgi:hypothetical protein